MLSYSVRAVTLKELCTVGAGFTDILITAIFNATMLFRWCNN